MPTDTMDVRQKVAGFALKWFPCLGSGKDDGPAASGGEASFAVGPVERRNDLRLRMPGGSQPLSSASKISNLFVNSIFQLDPNQVAGVKIRKFSCHHDHRR